MSGDKRVDPGELREAGEVGVRADDCQPVLECQSCDPRVTNQVASQVQIAHQPPKSLSVPATRLRYPRGGSVEPVSDEGPRVGWSEWDSQGPRVAHDAHERQQRLPG